MANQKQKKPMTKNPKHQRLALFGSVTYITVVIVVVIVFATILVNSARYLRQYNIDTYHEAVELFDNGEYGSALEKFWDLTKFRDSIFDGPPPQEYIDRCISYADQSTISYCPYCGHPLYDHK